MFCYYVPSTYFIWYMNFVRRRDGWTVQESNPGGGDVFLTRPDRPWGPPSLLYNGYRVFPGGVKRPGRVADHPPPSSAEVKERVELYICSPSGPSCLVIGRTVPLPLPLQCAFYSTK